jgi:hypothetical protein
MANAYAKTGRYKAKHAMHLIRLLYSGIEALRSGQIRIDVGKHREELLAVKAGTLLLEQARDRALELDREFQAAYRQTTLPEQPDYRQVDEFLIWARRRIAATQVLDFDSNSGYTCPNRCVQSPVFSKNHGKKDGQEPTMMAVRHGGGLSMLHPSTTPREILETCIIENTSEAWTAFFSHHASVIRRVYHPPPPDTAGFLEFQAWIPGWLFYEKKLTWPTGLSRRRSVARNAALSAISKTTWPVTSLPSSVRQPPNSRLSADHSGPGRFRTPSFGISMVSAGGSHVRIPEQQVCYFGSWYFPERSR